MTQTAVERLTSLNAKERQIAESMIRLNAERDTVASNVKGMSAEAIERFGSDDLDMLRERFVTAERENNERLDAYEAALKDVQGQLSTLTAGA